MTALTRRRFMKDAAAGALVLAAGARASLASPRKPNIIYILLDDAGYGGLYEGGIRVPMVAKWPGMIEPGKFTDHASAFWDVLPTLCEVAGEEAPEGFVSPLQGPAVFFLSFSRGRRPGL